MIFPVGAAAKIPGHRLEIEALTKAYRDIARGVLENVGMTGEAFDGEPCCFGTHAPGVAAVCGLGHGAGIG